MTAPERVLDDVLGWLGEDVLAQGLADAAAGGFGSYYMPKDWDAAEDLAKRTMEAIRERTADNGNEIPLVVAADAACRAAAQREAGMQALRGYHMAYWRDMRTATSHDHPVEDCCADPFVTLFAALTETQP